MEKEEIVIDLKIDKIFKKWGKMLLQFILVNSEHLKVIVTVMAAPYMPKMQKVKINF